MFTDSNWYVSFFLSLKCFFKKLEDKHCDSLMGMTTNQKGAYTNVTELHISNY